MSDTDLQDRYYRTIGKVICYWADFEVHFDMYLSALVDLSPASVKNQRLTQKFITRIRLWRDLEKTLFDDTARNQQLEHLSNLALRLHGKRDDVAHGRWQGLKSNIIPPHLLIFRHTDQAQISIAAIEIELLEELIADIENLDMQFTKFAGETAPALLEAFRERRAKQGDRRRTHRPRAPNRQEP